MESIIQSISLNPKIISRLRLSLTYFSALLFIGLVCFVSSSVQQYISDTLSISVSEIDPPQIISEEELPEDTSFTVSVQKGDTLKGILSKQNISNTDILGIIKIPDVQKIASSLKIGQTIVFDYDFKILEKDGEDLAYEDRTLTKMTFVIDKINSLEITRDGEKFVAKNATVPLNKVIAKSSTVINSSLMSALKSIGLSTNSIIEIINSYSHQIDFQRQIQPGDKVSVITEKFVREDGVFSHNGKILYASLNLSGKNYNIYHYAHDNSSDKHNFFSEDGKSVKRSLLRTPVNVVRVSSNYGKRKHPIQGFHKMHKGVDFQAPEGTPIYAAGDGVVTDAGWRSGYGKIVQIKHSPTLSTAYAHASKFAKNLKLGSRVKQGQIIAYVGKTGNTTGPHLHYEVKIDGKHVNPMSIKTTPGLQLAGVDLNKFKKFKDHVQDLSKKHGDEFEISENELKL